MAYFILNKALDSFQKIWPAQDPQTYRYRDEDVTARPTETSGIQLEFCNFYLEQNCGKPDHYLNPR